MISLNLPDEVIDGDLLPWLQWNDLLRFRRVCTTTQGITTDYMRLHPELTPEMEINDDDKTFTNFMELGIYTKKLYINNKANGYKFYQKDAEGISQFLEKYGKMIEHLRLEELSISIFGKEWDFLEALVNLKSLKAKRLDGLGENRRIEGETAWREAQRKLFKMALKDKRFKNGTFPFPESFRNLKSIKIDQEMGTWPIVNIVGHTVDLLQMNPDFEYFKVPFDPNTKSMLDLTGGIMRLETPKERQFVHEKPGRDQMYGRPVTMMAVLRTVQKYIKDRGKLRCFDFGCYHDFDQKSQKALGTLMSTGFRQFCQVCLENDVKLKNVSALWYILDDHLHPGEVVSPDLGIPVETMVAFDPCVFPLLMPNLTKIEIWATSLCNVGNNWRRQRPDWENLRSLDITVDSKVGTDQLFKFFFEGVHRLGLSELRLNFIEEADKVAIPKCEQIVESCPNLKKISIINWPGTNKKLVELWRGLEALEDVSLERCKNVGNVTFVGLDTKKPVFFGLKNLYKISLLGLDKMPKITDLLFSLVIQHLPLTQFILTSDIPVESVTQAGIECLLKDSFAKSIEKFPFSNWSLASISEEEFKKLEQKFRSYDMV